MDNGSPQSLILIAGFDIARSFRSFSRFVSLFHRSSFWTFSFRIFLFHGNPPHCLRAKPVY
jgi:hypothetical protein